MSCSTRGGTVTVTVGVSRGDGRVFSYDDQRPVAPAVSLVVTWVSRDGVSRGGSLSSSEKRGEFRTVSGFRGDLVRGWTDAHYRRALSECCRTGSVRLRNFGNQVKSSYGTPLWLSFTVLRPPGKSE